MYKIITNYRDDYQILLYNKIRENSFRLVILHDETLLCLELKLLIKTLFRSLFLHIIQDVTEIKLNN